MVLMRCPSSSASLVNARSSASSSAIRIVIGIVSLGFMDFGGGLFHRERHDKRRALTGRTMCHDLPAVAIRYFAAHRQTDSRSLVLRAAVEALEDDENLVGKLLLKA